MRFPLLAAALILAACARHENGQVHSACARGATHETSWTHSAAPDIITARADGPSCEQAVVTLVVRNASGDPLWAFASTYYDMTSGGRPPEGAHSVSNDQMDAFLASWADVTIMRSSELPAWREGATTLTDSTSTFTYETPFDRDAYEMLRARNLAMICYAAAVETTQCLILDPASQAPTMIVAYGP